MCVQHSLDSRNSAIHGAYRILLRPSSLLEPRHPSLKVVIGLINPIDQSNYTSKVVVWLSDDSNHCVLRLSSQQLLPTKLPKQLHSKIQVEIG